MNIDLIYQDIIDRAKLNPTQFTDNEQKVIDHFAWYHGQYQQQYDENKTHPFNRPAMFIQFGEFALEQNSGMGFNGHGKLPITLHIVQDLYVDGREGSAQHEGFKKMLRYWKLVADLYQGYRGNACAGAMVIKGWEADHTNDNLMVDKILLEVDVIYKLTLLSLDQ